MMIFFCPVFAVLFNCLCPVLVLSLYLSTWALSDVPEELMF